MTTYSAIANSEIAVGAPLTNSLMTKVRDNPLAIQENDASAPTVAYATLAGTVSSISAGSIGQSELNTANSEVSHASATATRITLPGGSYGFFPRVRMSNTSSYTVEMNLIGYNATAVTGWTSSITSVYMRANASQTMYAAQRYMVASPPYDLGDGVVGRFIFAVIDNATKKIESVYQSTEAPWHFNGPTDVRGKLMANGKKYRERKNMPDLGFTLKDAIAVNNKIQIQEYTDTYNAATSIIEEITQEIKQADMSLIPHPFTGNDLTGKTVVMLDPISDLNHHLSELVSTHDDFDLNGLLHDNYFKIGNTGLNRFGPDGVLIVDFNWKKTK